MPTIVFASSCEGIKADSPHKLVEKCLIERFESDQPLLQEILDLYFAKAVGENVWACNPASLDDCDSELRRKLTEAQVFWVGVVSPNQYVFNVFEGRYEAMQLGYFFVYPHKGGSDCPAEIGDELQGVCEIDLGNDWSLSRNWWFVQ